MARTYIIRTWTFGDVRKADDNISDARKWAKRAFERGEVITVFREYATRYCDDCCCAPCCCMVRRDA